MTHPLPSERCHSGWRQRFVYVLVMMMFFFIYKCLDPLGLETATKQTSAVLFNAITTPFYGMGSLETHKRVAVVEISDPTLDHFGTAFPLSYSRHASILNHILDGQPAAIFVDFRMMREQPGESFETFRPVLDRARNMRIPILFARGEAGHEQSELPQQLRAWQVYSNGLEASGAYPLFEEEGEKASLEKKNEAGKKEPEPVNPAWAFYSTLCHTTWTDRCGNISPADFSSPMIIHWGLHADPAQSLVSDQSEFWQNDCADHPILHCTRLGAALRLGVAYLFFHTIGGDRQFAFYPLVIGAEQLSHSALNAPPRSPALSSLLAGRAVFYGSDIRDQHDDTNIPLLGRMPGVVVHAMAFDNLVTYGRRYFHEPSDDHSIFGFRPDRAELLEGAIWFLFGIRGAFRRKDPSGHTPHFPAPFLQNFRKNCSENGLFQDFLTSLRDSRPLRVTLCAMAALIMISLAASRNFTMQTLPNLIGIWLCISALFIGTWGLKPRQTPEPGEAAERSLISQLFFLGSLSAIGFTLNQTVFRWPDADWIGLLLLWFATSDNGEEAEERNKFVEPICKAINGAADFLQKKLTTKNAT
ncbi:CHASE2 domain-containing protein [Gluconobacter japonicus]|uniref:CHASE2 domain-containing protein n=1 Tax=Gluconobacter japonicus TaxID=376620 RepID=UPI001B8D66C1|nr:CHASE2 domain-containing protein [Gluconobacter japonicus]MBS1051757.1 CHASE2 domain-containing protein [Gluconobacter japonicus]